MQATYIDREGVARRVDAIVAYLEAGTAKDSIERLLVLELQSLLLDERHWYAFNAPRPESVTEVRVDNRGAA